jgi:precorrin-6A/cobalt-precorrin-6A reductase
MRVMVMAGTSDAVCIIGKLAEYEDLEVIATTTTSYGGDLALSAGADKIIVGRQGVQEIVKLLDINRIDLLVDATHPFASEASINAIKASHKFGIKYIRYERPSIKIPDQVFEVSSFQEAGIMAKKIMEKNLNARMMHLAGVTTLNEITKTIDPKLIVARILPMISSIKKCFKIGIPSDNIIAMQGTFSKEFNKALMKEYAIGVVVTKESGETGGTHSKIAAANELEIPLIIVKRPIIREMENESVFKDIDHLLKNIVASFKN